ncbi:hypothetical protein IIA95_01110 [Patescibacteria group bacterium]|nr:hypothetical protein [Patescibacteria group bacterium]
MLKAFPISNGMKVFDVGIGWANPVDRVFIETLKLFLKKEKLSFHEITFVNLTRAYEEIRNGKIHYKTFIDRASEDHPAYLLIAEKLKERGTCVINDPHHVIRFASKSFLHRLFEAERLPVPRTFVISPTASKKLSKSVAKTLGIPFVLKPSYSGLQDVTLTARTAGDIMNFLKENLTDECLAQEYVAPSLINGRTAWFRPIFVCGRTIVHWWDPKNQFYHSFGRSREEQKIGRVLDNFMQKIFQITGFKLFSSEVAMDKKGKFLIIDYANHPIDLNSQEITPDGLPLETIRMIASSIVKSI